MKIFLLVALAALVGLISTTFFTVDETEQGLVIQFGAYVRTVTEPGLEWKIPFVQTFTRYEKRLMRHSMCCSGPHSTV